MSDVQQTVSRTRKKFSPITIFVVSAFVWMAVLIGVWMVVAKWTSLPVGVVAGTVLEKTAPMWVKTTINTPGNLEVDSRIHVLVPGSGGRRAEIILDANPARYAYGLPIFLALLFAARRKNIVGKALLGYALLIPFQAFTVVFYILKEIVVASQFDLAQLRVSMWQIEGIVYGFQFGTLVVPTLLPIMIWLWLDREFFFSTVAKGYFKSNKH